MNGLLEFLRVELEFVAAIRRSDKIHLIEAAATRETEIRKRIRELESEQNLAVCFAESREGDASPEG